MKGEKRQGQKDLRAKYDSQSFMCFQKYVAVGSQQINKGAVPYSYNGGKTEEMSTS